MLCAMLTMLGVQQVKADNTWTASNLTDGKYVFKNVETGRYLGPGNDWGTQASLIQCSHFNTLAKVSDGVYTIESQVNNSGTNYYFTGSYMDGAAANVTIKDNGNGIYTMSNGSTYYGYDGSTYVLSSSLTDPESTYAQWKIMAYDEVYTDYADYPVDVTYMILCPNFDRNHRNSSAWTMNASNKNLSGGDNTNRCAESYHSTFTLSQTLTGLPSGKYKVRAQATENNASPSAVVYAGDQTVSFNTMTHSESDMSACSTQFTAGEYYTDWMTVNVTDGSLTIGTKSTSKENWCVWDNFQLQYTDPYLSIIAEEFTSGNTMEAGQWYKYTVSTDGDYTLSATEGIVYAVSDGLASAATTAATSTVALPAGTVYFKSTTSQALTITHVEPVVDNGVYYLYDATNKLFLSRGNAYGTEASMDKYGVPFTWSNYSKTFEFVDWTGVYMFITGTSVYTDNGWSGGSISDAARFAFVSDGNGGYYVRDKGETVYLTHTAGDYGEYVKTTTTQGEATVWTIKTKAERDAIVNAYPTDNKTAVITAAGISTTAAEFETYLSENYAAKDKTSSVSTAKFTGSAGDWNWSVVRTQTNPAQPAYGTDYAEAWLATGSWTQTVSNLPAGIYKITVNGFERRAANATAYALGEAGYNTVVSTYLSANGEQVQFKSWYDEVDTSDGYNPNNTTQAATAFNNDKYKNEVYAYVTDDGEGTGSLTLKVVKPNYVFDCWTLWNNVTLTYYDTNVSDDEATSIISEAATAMTSPMKHSLYAALVSAKSTFEASQTVPNYSALRTAIDNTATSITSYANMYTNYLQPLNTYFATTNFVQSDAYNTYLGYKNAYDKYTEDGTEDVENATANALSITSGSKTNYTSTYSLMMLPNWTKGGTEALSNSGFYVNSWSTESDGSGDAADFANPFFEYWVSSGSLSATSIVGTMTGLTANTIYKVTANVRVQGSSKVSGSITMQVGDGAETDVTAGSQIGSTARYIGSYTAIGMTDEDGNLTLTFTVAASSNISWLAFRDVNYEAVTTVADAKNYLSARIAAATTLYNSGANVGTGVFQIPEAAGSTFNSAISTATTEYNNGSSTLSSVTLAASTMNTAIDTYNDAELNAPESGKRYKLTLANKGTLYFKSSNAWGGYGFPFTSTVADYMAQAFILTKTSGNTYTLSFTNLAGTTQYICNGVPAGANTGAYGIRSSTSSGNALPITIQALNTEGNFYMLNTTASNTPLGATSSGDLYTTTDYCTWSIAEASEAEPNLTIAADVNWATFISPFAVSLKDLDEVEAFTVSETDDDVLTLAAVEDDVIPANTPVILYRATTGSNYSPSLSGWGTACATEYKYGLLTGRYETGYIPAGSYGLQKNGEVAFYLVENDDEIKVGANRAYLTVESGARTAYFFNGEDNETAISSLSETTTALQDLLNGADIYDLNGRKVNGNLQKGKVYIVNGKKLYVK